MEHGAQAVRAGEGRPAVNALALQFPYRRRPDETEAAPKIARLLAELAATKRETPVQWWQKW